MLLHGEIPSYQSLSRRRFTFSLTGIPFIYGLSERSGLDLSEIAFSVLAEKLLEYILGTLQPLSGLLIVPVSLSAWSRHGWRDERRRHHTANGVIPDCRQIAFRAEPWSECRIFDLTRASAAWLTLG